MSIRIDDAADVLVRTANLPSNTAITACGWCYVVSDLGTGTQQMIFSTEYQSGSEVGVGLAWEIADGKMAVFSYNGSTLNSTEFASRPATGTWFFWYIRCDGTGAGRVQAGWKAQASLTFVTATTTLTTGLSASNRMIWGNDNWNEYADCRLANLQVFDAFLTDADLLNIASTLRPQVTANLNLWCPTFIGSDEHLVDYSGNGRNLSAPGSVLTDDDQPPVSWGAAPLAVGAPAGVSDVVVSLNAATITASGQAITATGGPVTVDLAAAALSALGQTVTVSAPAAGPPIPAGVICIWPGTHASIPTGWSRVTALDGLYPKGAADATDPGGTGGNNTHSHTTANHTHAGSHTHTVPDSPQGSGSTNRDAGSVRPPATHTHTGNPSTANPTVNTLTNDTPSTDSPSNEPSYFVGIFIESDGTPTGFPATAIIPWDQASAPAGWTFCDGSGSTPDLRGKYIKGAAALGNGGGTGGAATHTHTIASHTHGTNYGHAHPNVTSSQTGASMVGGPVSGSNAATATQTHTHALTIGNQATDAITGNTDSTDTPNHEPPYVLLGWIQNTSGTDSYPNKSIALWIGTLLNIPTDYALCNGTGNVDTRSKFIKGATTLAGVGTTGGNLTHSHTATGHTHAVASHAHTVSAASGAGSNETAGAVACSTTGHTHPSWSDTGASSFTSGSGTPTVNDYTDTQPSYYAVAWIQYTTSIAPTTVTLNAAALSAAGQTTSILVGDVSVLLAAATLTASGQIFTAAPGPVSILFSAATLTASGQASTVVPGEASVILSAAALSAIGQVISVLPGDISSSLSAAVLTASGQVVTVSLATDVLVNLLAASLSAQGQAITIVPGDVSPLLSAAALSASGQAVTIEPGAVSTTLTAATLSAIGQTLTVVPGAVDLLLSVATLAAQGQVISIVPGDVSSLLAAALLTANGQTVTVSNITGLVVSLSSAVLASQGQTITSVGGPVSSSLSAATLTATGQTVSILPGATSVIVSAATLLAQGQVITPVGGPVSSILDTAMLAAQGQALSVVPGAASVLLNVAALTASGQVVTISAPPGGLVVTLASATLLASGQATTVVPGAVSTLLDTAILTAYGQPITMGGAPVVVPVINPGGGGGGPFTRPDYEVPYDMERVLAAQEIIDEEEILFLV